MISKFIKGLVILATLSLAGCFSNSPPEDVLRQAVSTPETRYSVRDGWKLIDVKVTNEYDSNVNGEKVDTIEYVADFLQVSDPYTSMTVDGKTHHMVVGRAGLAKRGNSWYLVVPNQVISKSVRSDK